jgi:hypothetical protein
VIGVTLSDTNALKTLKHNKKAKGTKNSQTEPSVPR